MTNEARRQDAENRLAVFLKENGYSYMGGYKSKNSHITVACLTCGGTFTRYVENVSKLKTISCPICADKKREAKQIEKQHQAEEREDLRKQHKVLKEQERRAGQNKRLDNPHICPICHKTFTIREYAESIGTDPMFIPNVEFCSKKCRNKGHKTSRYIERAKLHGCEWESGVTLSKLLKRDGLRCALCGELCDPNDTSWGNGSGPLYPSMDHKIPLAKGGTHTWDNVQVAHLICNSFKNIKFV